MADDIRGVIEKNDPGSEEERIVSSWLDKTFAGASGECRTGARMIRIVMRHSFNPIDKIGCDGCREIGPLKLRKALPEAGPYLVHVGSWTM